MAESDALASPIFGAFTQAVSSNERLIDFQSKEFKNVLQTEKDYLRNLLIAFGPNAVPKDKWAEFKPAVVVTDSTTVDDLKPVLSNLLTSGVEYWKAFIKAAKFSPTGEAQLALHERGLGFLNGERHDSRSYIEVVDQMSSLASFYAGGQREDRINELYVKENSKSPLWAGKFAYGKIGVLWNVGGSQICHYEEAFRNHIQIVKNFALSKVVPH